MVAETVAQPKQLVLGQQYNLHAEMVATAGQSLGGPTRGLAKTGLKHGTLP